MKKLIIGLSLVALTLSSAAHSGDNDYLIAAGLIGLGLILGDGHTSLGVHYHSDGYYNYRNQRYYNRAAYLRAVERYERQRRYYQNLNNNRYSFYYRDNSYSSGARFNARYLHNDHDNDSRRNNSDSRSNSDERDRNQNSQSDRDRSDNDNRRSR